MGDLLILSSNNRKMVFCSNCGNQLNDSNRFCPKCGQAATAAGNLPQVTDAVRGYAANATDEEVAKRAGKQQWGLFETNYQRNKGISTEQSLQEIENFVGGSQGGASRGGNTGSGSTGSAGYRGGSAGGAGNGGFNISTTETSTITFSGGSGTSNLNANNFGGNRGGAGSGTGHIPNSGNSGASYFSNHLANEKKRYGPRGNLGQ
eukprot:TRINITY_DN96_c0_g1_i1.p1 TRINITY_DN96_c0_g1~~TRINITY_DN96_c0_g1_i1.p1  ORF type:complete len:205 (-),score=51.85 TRINITY_DN96_c0_g1_i1:59-673(-)